MSELKFGLKAHDLCLRAKNDKITDLICESRDLKEFILKVEDTAKTLSKIDEENNYLF